DTDGDGIIDKNDDDDDNDGIPDGEDTLPKIYNPSGSSFEDHNDPIVSQDLTPEEGSAWVDSEELKVTQSATQEVVNRRHTDASNLYEAKLPDTGEASSIETVGLGLTVLFVAGALSKRKKSED
ncbi:LPXTG cell wall anchor domain-containing protein, partial [Streptococcus pluranimalium]